MKVSMSTSDPFPQAKQMQLAVLCTLQVRVKTRYRMLLLRLSLNAAVIVTGACTLARCNLSADAAAQSCSPVLPKSGYTSYTDKNPTLPCQVAPGWACALSMDQRNGKADWRSSQQAPAPLRHTKACRMGGM